MKLYTKETLIQAMNDAAHDGRMGEMPPYDLEGYESVIMKRYQIEIITPSNTVDESYIVFASDVIEARAEALKIKAVVDKETGKTHDIRVTQTKP